MSATKKRPAAKRGSRVGVLAGGVLLLLIALGVTFALSPRDEAVEGAKEYRAVTVTGSALPRLPEEGADPAVGAPAPALFGQNFLGTPVSAPAAGRGTVLAFLAHWCPHCRAEVPVIVENITPTNLPANVDLIGIATSTSETEANYPPSAWLDREGWLFPVIADSSLNQAAEAYGVNSFPFFVVIGSDGTVLLRTSGELPVGQLQGLFTLAAG